MIAPIVAVLLAAVAPAKAATPDGCPDAPTAIEAIQRLTMTQHFRPGWVRAIDRFEFGPVTYGDPFSGPVPTTDAFVMICPVFVAYTFTIAYKSGEERRVRGGRNIIHGFFRDVFDEWTVRAIRGADQVQ